MNWQSIETVPTDGTPVLLYSPDARDPQIFVGVCYEGEWFDYWREDGCWPIDAEATHWMPLPDKPLSPSPQSLVPNLDNPAVAEVDAANRAIGEAEEVRHGKHKRLA